MRRPGLHRSHPSAPERNPCCVRRGLVAACLMALLAASGASAGDTYWSRRSIGMRDAVADPAPVRAAVRAYAAALETDPADLEARWKLLRALHFEGEFATVEADARRRIFDRARAVSDEGLRRLRVRLGASPHEIRSQQLRQRLGAAGLATPQVSRLYYWAAANWGSWSRHAGLVDAVRSGAANRLRDYLGVVIALEPGYEGGGAHRFLGALHARLPRLPLVSGWVDRDRALPQLESALALAPDEPSNRLLLGLTLLDLEPARRREGLSVLSEVAGLEPRPTRRVEDAVVVREAQRRLEREGHPGAPPW